MRKIHGAYILIKFKDKYIFQVRDNKPGISSPGKLSAFGGAREPYDKNLLENAIRELGEETSLPVNSLIFTKLGIVRGDTPEQWDGEVFITEVQDNHFKVFEGKGFLALTKDEIDNMDRTRFARSAQEIIDRFIK